MAGKCKYCGGVVEWRDNQNWRREFCEECAQRVADGEDLRATYDPDGEPKT